VPPCDDLPRGKGSKPAALARRWPLARLGVVLAAAADQEPPCLLSRLLHGRGGRPAGGAARRVAAAAVVQELHRALPRAAGPTRAPQARGARLDPQGEEAAPQPDDRVRPAGATG